jgi:hypothetical protein
LLRRESVKSFLRDSLLDIVVSILSDQPQRQTGAVGQRIIAHMAIPLGVVPTNPDRNVTNVRSRHFYLSERKNCNSKDLYSRAGIITWLTALSRLENAEEKLLEMLSNAERLAKSLKDWPSVRPTDDSSKQCPGATPLFEGYSWRDSPLINDTLEGVPCGPTCSRRG